MTVYIIKPARGDLSKFDVLVTFKTLKKAKAELAIFDGISAYKDLKFGIYKLTIKKERVK